MYVHVFMKNTYDFDAVVLVRFVENDVAALRELLVAFFYVVAVMANDGSAG
jgi:hypothetical protein